MTTWALDRVLKANAENDKRGGKMETREGSGIKECLGPTVGEGQAREKTAKADSYRVDRGSYSSDKDYSGDEVAQEQKRGRGSQA